MLKKHWDKAALFVVLAVFSVQVIHFVAVDRTVPQSDTLSHSAFAARLHRILTGEKPLAAYANCAHPPLTQLVSGAFFAVAGRTPRVALYSLLVFSLVLLLSVYGLGRHLGGRVGGLAAAMLAASHGHLIHHGGQYYIDMPGAAMALLALWALLRTDGFRHGKASLWFGLCLGLAMLTKWTNLVFLAPAMVILPRAVDRSRRGLGVLGVTAAISAALLYGYYRLGVERSEPGLATYLGYEAVCATGLAAALWLKRRLARGRGAVTAACNGAAALFLAQALIYPVYLFQAGPVVFHFTRQGALVHNDTFSGLLATNVYSLIHSFSGGALLAAVGLVLAATLLRRASLRDAGLLGLSVVVGLLATSHACPSFYRYLLVPTGLAAVAGGYWLGRVGRIGVWGLGLLGLYALLPATAYFWGVPQLPQHDELQMVKSAEQLRQEFRVLPRASARPDPRAYQLEALMDAAQADFRQHLARQAGVALVFEALQTARFKREGHRRALPMLRQDVLFFAQEYFLDADLLEHLAEDDIKVATSEDRLAQTLGSRAGPVYLMVFYVDKAEVADLQIQLHLKLRRAARTLRDVALPHGRRARMLVVGAGSAGSRRAPRSRRPAGAWSRLELRLATGWTARTANDKQISVALPDLAFMERPRARVTYVNRFRLPAALPPSGRARLRISGAFCRLGVKLNGQRLADGMLPGLPHEVDVTAALSPTGDNRLELILADRDALGLAGAFKPAPPLRPGALPSANAFSSWRRAHLRGPVELVLTGDPSISGVRASPSWRRRRVGVRVDLHNGASGPRQARLTAALHLGPRVVAERTVSPTLPPGRSSVGLELPVAAPVPWGAPPHGSNRRYLLVLTLHGEAGPTDQVARQVGFAETWPTREGLMLNGKPLFLLAHATAPDLRGDLDVDGLLAASSRYGFNAWHVHFGTTGRAQFELCDELGVYLVPSLVCTGPLNQHAAGVRGFARRYVAGWLRAHHGSPSVVLWGQELMHHWFPQGKGLALDRPAVDVDLRGLYGAEDALARYKAGARRERPGVGDSPEAPTGLTFIHEIHRMESLARLPALLRSFPGLAGAMIRPLNLPQEHEAFTGLRRQHPGLSRLTTARQVLPVIRVTARQRRCLLHRPFTRAPRYGAGALLGPSGSARLTAREPGKQSLWVVDGKKIQEHTLAISKSPLVKSSRTVVEFTP